MINPLNTDWYRCPKCKNSFLLKSDDSDKHLLAKSKSLRCPNFRECEGRLVLRKFTPNTHNIENARWVTALELFQAAAGIGLPEERNCSPKDIRKLMAGSRITAVHVENAPDPKKSILMSLTLDGSKTVHISTSTKGAIIYKVTNGR